MAKELGLVRRGNRWYYRKRIPDELVASFGGKLEIKVSLKTEVYAEAKILRNQVATRIDRILARRRRQLDFASVSSEIHRFVAEKSKIDGEKTRKSKLDGTDALNETIENIQIYQDPDDERTRVAIGSLTKMIFPNLLPEVSPKLSFVDKIHAEARVPDISAHLPPSRREELDELLRTSLLELELRALDALKGQIRHAPHQPNFLAPGESPITLEMVTEKFLQERFNVNGVTVKRQKSMRAEAAMMLHILGGNVLISRIDRNRCREFRDTLNRLPSNINKHFPEYQTIDLEILISDAQRKSLPRMKNATQNKYVSLLKGMLAFAVSEEHIKANPFPDLRALGEKTPAKRARNSFDADDLDKIFSIEPFVASSKKRWNERYWAPLIGLFTGMRLNEICQLDIADVRQSTDKIWYIDINDEAEDKSVKNDGSHRQLPVHSELIKLGFVRFVLEERKRRGTGKLFEGIRKRPDGNYGHDLSKWFNRTFLKLAKVKTAKKSFHSLRHSFRDALSRGDVRQQFVEAFGGWNASQHGVSSNYGDGPTLFEKAKELEKVSYPELDLSHLYDPKISWRRS